MITRFFSAVRRAILAIPGNPYAEINRLKRREGFLEMRVTSLNGAYRDLRAQAHKDRAAKNAANFRTTQAEKALGAAMENWLALNSTLSDQLDASEQANEEFMRERHELKRMVRAHAILGLSFAQAAGEAEATINAISGDLAEHVEANEALAAAVAELQAERNSTVPFLQAVEAKLGAVGVTVEDTDIVGEEPVVTIDSTKIAAAIRSRSVKLAPSAPIAA